MAKKLFCSSCGSINRPKTRTKGSLLIEIILWVCIIIPGIIYSIWRLTTRSKVCRDCGGSSLIPENSPIAKKMLSELNAANTHKAQNSPDEKRGNRQNDVTEEELRFRIAKDGKDIGEMKSSEIRQYLSQGSLSSDDYYWNVEQNAWVNLSSFHH